jgi:FkbM family methyltransferase
MNILWLSNAPWAATGYGNQTRLFTKRINDLPEYSLSIAAFYGLEGAPLTWDGIKIYPRAYHPYGVDIAAAHGDQIKADVIISLIDAWVMDADLLQSNGARWIPWFPVDSEPLPAAVLGKIKDAYKRIVFSRFGEKMVHDAGLDCYYVPHGIDTKTFKPGDRKVARERLKLPEGKFIVGMVAANKGFPSRKSFPECIFAFAKFHEEHPHTLLYLHTTKSERGEMNGMNLPAYIEGLGLKLGEDVIFCDQYHGIIGFPDNYMVDLYNAFDVLLSPSMGEGFGIPILEAQACGCPVIVGDWTAMSELCFAGWKIAKEHSHMFWDQVGAYKFMPNPAAIYQALAQAYTQAGKLRHKARKGAEGYDVERVMAKYWKPVLKEIAALVDEWKPKHVHEWIKVGLFNPDGSLSTPCKACGAEALSERGKPTRIIDGGFENPDNLEFVHPDGLEWLLLRETRRDYGADKLNLNKSSIVVDIGAHVGVVSMSLAKRYGCKVIAFEPNPDNFARLLENIIANNLGSLITALPCAVTGDGRKVKIGTDTDNSGGNDIYGDGVEVESVTLAEIMDRAIGTVDLLKIDAEGAEYEILKDVDLSNIRAIRGEFHGQDGKALLDAVTAKVPDTRVTLQGWTG